MSIKTPGCLRSKRRPPPRAPGRRPRCLVIAVIGVAVAAAGGVLITRGLSLPVREAAQAALRLARGDLSMKVDRRSQPG